MQIWQWQSIFLCVIKKYNERGYEKYKTCISNGEHSAKCYRYSVPYISWSSFDVEKYDFSTPLNVWKTLGLNRKERDKGNSDVGK